MMEKLFKFKKNKLLVVFIVVIIFSIFFYYENNHENYLENSAIRYYYHNWGFGDSSYLFSDGYFVEVSDGSASLTPGPLRCEIAYISPSEYKVIINFMIDNNFFSLPPFYRPDRSLICEGGYGIAVVSSQDKYVVSGPCVGEETTKSLKISFVLSSIKNLMISRVNRKINACEKGMYVKTERVSDCSVGHQVYQSFDELEDNLKKSYLFLNREIYIEDDGSEQFFSQDQYYYSLNKKCYVVSFTQQEW